MNREEKMIKASQIESVKTSIEDFACELGVKQAELNLYFNNDEYMTIRFSNIQKERGKDGDNEAD